MSQGARCGVARAWEPGLCGALCCLDTPHDTDGLHKSESRRAAFPYADDFETDT